MKDALVSVGLASPFGFVLLATVAKFYFVMPATLSFFKRNGIVFKKPDVNLMFSTPISPKQILIFALFKQAYVSVLMDVAFFVAAIFIFNIPVGSTILFFGVNFIFSNLMQYSLALIMYGSEDLTEDHKQNIKLIIYALMIIVTIWAFLFFVFNGFSIESFTNIVDHPFVLMIPIFGWELGWLNTVVMGPTIFSVIASVLFVISALVLARIAYKMTCTGDYYEDSLNFAIRQAKILEKQGDASIKEMLGKERKINQSKAVLKGVGAKVIFSRQIMERKRTTKFFFSMGDYLMLLVGIGAGIAGRIYGFDSAFFYVGTTGFFLYILIFFTPQHSWRNDFNQYYIFVMPETMLSKLFYSTLFDNFISLMKSVFLTVPFGLILGANIFEIVLAVITQILLKVMASYLSIFFSVVIGAKIGKQFGQLISLFVTMLTMILPVTMLVLSLDGSILLSTIGISFYSIIVGAIYFVLCTKLISNIESLKD